MMDGEFFLDFLRGHGLVSIHPLVLAPTSTNLSKLDNPQRVKA
jgi:hypothetical protein